MLAFLFPTSEDAELLWRLARASRDVAQLSGTSEEEKKLLVYGALEYARRALDKNQSSSAAHKVSFLKELSYRALRGTWSAICVRKKIVLFLKRRKDFFL